MDGKGNRLINIFGPNETPEQKQQKEAERKRLHDERVKREGEVKALFDEYDKIYEKQRYIARVPELLKYLKTKKHAITFWSNPHVKMIYNISDHRNFLLSIYAEETNNRKYEEWLRKYFSNPFKGYMAINYDTFNNCCDYFVPYDSNLNFRLHNLLQKQNEYKRFTIMERECSFLTPPLKRYHFIKALPINELLDKDRYLILTEKYKSLPDNFISAEETLGFIEQSLMEAERCLTATELGNEMQRNLLGARDYLTNVSHYLMSIHGDLRYGENDDPIPSIYFTLEDELRNCNLDETDTAITQQALARALQTARTAQRKAEADYNHLLQDFCEKVYFYHPLIMMDNNFISIDTYNYWRKIYKEQWDEVTKKDPDMFAILDALVKSRKIYLKEINK